MIIDIHAHTTNHTLWGLSVKSATIDELEKQAKKYGVAKIFLMATYFPFKGTGLHNLELAERIRGHRLFSMFGSLDAMNDFDGGLIELERLAEKGIVSGIKLYPGYQDYSLRDKRRWGVFDLAAKYRLPVAIHAGDLHHCCPYEARMKNKTRCGKECQIDKLQHLAHPKEFADAIARYPDVNFIISHLGNPFFDEIKEVMKNFPNTYTDISGIDDDDEEWKKRLTREIKEILEISGAADRIMFATDFPIQTYEETIRIVESLSLTPEEKEKIYCRNAQKLFNIKEK